MGKYRKRANLINSYFRSCIKSGTNSLLVEAFAAQDLQVVEEENELDHNQDSGDDESSVLHIVDHNVPYEEDGGDEEEDGGHKRVDLLQLVGGELNKVEDEEDNVDYDADKVESRGEANASLAEAQVGGVHVGHCSWFG